MALEARYNSFFYGEMINMPLEQKIQALVGRVFFLTFSF
jgi:hypothetical protein